MAIQKGKYLQGALGDFVYKIVRGRQIVCSRPVPGTMHQTIATINASNTFGMAASLGSSIRNSLAGRINGYGDGEMTNRLSSIVYKTLADCRDSETRLYSFEEDSFSNLEGFEFNIRSVLDYQLSNTTMADHSDGILSVAIPELMIDKELKFPVQTYQCKILVNLSCFRLGEGLMAKDPDSQILTVNRDEKILEDQTLRFEIPDGCLCIVSIFLEYANYGIDISPVINHKNFNPGRIIKAFLTPGTYQKNDSRNWIGMKQFKFSNRQAD